jgi:hypothetical protein
MSLPLNTLWYNGDWDLFVGINDVVDPTCPCLGPTGPDITVEENCVSRPPNELNDTLLMGTYTDFLVTDPGGWLVTGLFSDNFTFIDAATVITLEATYEIRSGVSATSVGTVVFSGSGPVTTIPTGRSVLVGLVLYTEYRFIVTGLNQNLSPDRYWVNVAPIIPAAVLDSFSTDFVMFNSTTQGVNAVGVPAGNNANDFFAVGNSNPTVFIPSTNFSNQFHDFSNGVLGLVLPVCIDPNMSVFMYDNSRKRVADLVPGDLVQTQDPNKPARIAINYKNPVSHKVLVKFDENSIKPGVPDALFLITTNHKILVGSDMVKPKDLINGINIRRSRRPKPVFTHTIITDGGEPIIINNVPVVTWAYDYWTTRKHLKG